MERGMLVCATGGSICPVNNASMISPTSDAVFLLDSKMRARRDASGSHDIGEVFLLDPSLRKQSSTDRCLHRLPASLRLNRFINRILMADGEGA